MKNIDPEKNCHEYCPVAKCCRYLKGENGYDPDDCYMRYKIEDLLQDAALVKREQEQEDDDW